MAWVLIGQVLNAIAILAMIKVWAVYLTPDQLGLMGLIIGIASILLGVLMGPYFQAILVCYAKYNTEDKNSAFRLISRELITRRAVIAVSVVLIFGYTLVALDYISWPTPLLTAGLLSVDTVRVFEQRFLTAARRQKEVAFLLAGDTVVRLIGVWITLHLLDNNALEAVLGNFLGATLFLFCVRLMIHSETMAVGSQIEQGLKREITSTVEKIAKPLLPAQLLSNLTEMGNRYLIAATLGLHASGMFIAGHGFVRRPYGMLNNIGEVTFIPILANAVAEKTNSTINSVRIKWIAFIFIFSLSGAILFYFLREYLTILLLSDKYMEISELLFGLAFALMLYNLASVFNWFSMTLGNSRAVLINNIVGATATSVLTIVLCLMLGISGAVWALIVGYGMQLVASILTYLAVRKRQLIAKHPVTKPSA